MKNLVLRNIFGRKVKLNIPTTEENEETREVVKVATLPETGKEGELYYNTTNKKWYSYNSIDGFKPIGSDKFEVIRTNQRSFDIVKNKLYITSSDGIEYMTPIGGGDPVAVGDPSFVVTIADAVSPVIDAVLGADGPYLVRFTCQADDTSITVRIPQAKEKGHEDDPTVYYTIPVAANAPEFEVGHTYEVNVLADLVSIYDVTPADGE